MVKSKKPIVGVVVPNGLKYAVEKTSKRLGCSQGEVVRTALYEFLKPQIQEQIKKSDHK